MNKQRSSIIVRNLGGTENISSIDLDNNSIVIYVKNTDSVDLESLKIVDQIEEAFHINKNKIRLTMNVENSQLKEILVEQFKLNLENNEKNPGKETLVTQIFGFLSKIFHPIVPAFAGAGILKGILLLLNQLGLISDGSGVFQLLSIASNGIFYFLPVMLAFTTSKVLNTNPFIGVLIAFSLLHPDFSMFFNTNTQLDFLGLPVVLIDYSSTVIPIVLSIGLYKILYDFLEKRLSDTLKTILIPLLTLAIIFPLTVLIVGPIGYYSGEFLAQIVTWLMNTNGVLTGIVIGGIWLIVIATGLNWAINPIMLNNISAFGYDFIRPFTFASNFATLGLVIGISLASRKNKELKNYARANIFTIAVSGMVEPTIFGILVKHRKYFVAQIIGGTAGAAYMGLMGVSANTFVFGSMITLTALVGEEPSNFINGLIGLAISTITAAVLAFIITTIEEKT